MKTWGIIFYIHRFPYLFCVCETRPDKLKSAKHVGIMHGMGEGEGWQYRQFWKSAKHILLKIHEILESVHCTVYIHAGGEFFCFYRYFASTGQTCSTVCKILKLKKYDDGRRPDGVSKFEKCIRLLWRRYIKIWSAIGGSWELGEGVC
jgi:hypothetical protein